MTELVQKNVLSYFNARRIEPTIINKGALAIRIVSCEAVLNIVIEADNTNEHAYLMGIVYPDVPEEKFDAVYKILNECNERYDHIKFVLDTKSKVIRAISDNVIQLDSCGAVCYELMYRMMCIVRAAYPVIKNAIQV